jgi:hypothetical protein
MADPADLIGVGVRRAPITQFEGGRGGVGYVWGRAAHRPFSTHQVSVERLRRDRDIVQRRAAGQTYQTIADAHQLSASRAWQIVEQATRMRRAGIARP